MNHLQMPNLEDISFYHSIMDNPIIQDFKQLIDAYSNQQSLENFSTSYQSIYYDLKAKMLDYAYVKDDETHYAKQPWCDLIISFIISDENSMTSLFSRGEVTEQHPYYKNVLKEFKILNDLYHFDWDTFLTETGLDTSNIFESPIFFPLPPHDYVDIAFKRNDINQSFRAVNRYVAHYGLSVYQNNNYFCIQDESGHPYAISNQDIFPMDDLLGYAKQKEEIIRNTTNFVIDGIAKNVLIRGELGTGKATMVKSLLHVFKKENLKIIEVPVAYIHTIPSVLKDIQHHTFPFLIFINNLSQEIKESDAKLLMELLTYSQDHRIFNIAFCATLNTRTQSLNEGADAPLVLDTKWNWRKYFDIILNIPRPNQTEYLAIVNKMAIEADLNIPIARLENQALQWELRHVNRSGRTAAQFIQSLKAQKKYHK